MAKKIKQVGMEETMIADIQALADEQFGGNFTAAMADCLQHSLLVRSIPEGQRDLLRVSAKRGPYAEEYDRNEKAMFDFFLV